MKGEREPRFMETQMREQASVLGGDGVIFGCGEQAIVMGKKGLEGISERAPKACYSHE
jgi:hypothetical protein